MELWAAMTTATAARRRTTSGAGAENVPLTMFGRPLRADSHWMRTRVRALTALGIAGGLLVLPPSGATAATGLDDPARLREASCTADGGVWSTTAGVRSCTVVAVRTVSGPVVPATYELSQSFRSGGSVLTLTATSRRASTVERTTKRSQRGDGPTTTVVFERVAASAVTPLSCAREFRSGGIGQSPVDESGPADFGLCAQHELFNAPPAPIDLVDERPGPTPDVVDRQSCLTSGGAFTSHAGVRRCAVVHTREVAGPVVSATFEDSWSGFFNGSRLSITGTSQRLSTVESTTTWSQHGDSAVVRVVAERVLSSTVRPLTCQRLDSRGGRDGGRSESGPAALALCERSHVFTAPPAPLDLVDERPGPAPDRLSDKVCAAYGGTFTRDAGVKRCTIVLSSQASGADTTRSATTQQDSPPSTTTLTGTSREVQLVETTVTWSQRGNRNVTEEVARRVAGSTVVPLSCDLYRTSGVPNNSFTQSGPTDLDACEDAGLYAP